MNSNADLRYLSPNELYPHFLKTIAETDELWTLIDNDGRFALFEVNNKTVFSVWPDETSIESNITPDWQDYIPFKINLDELEETIIPLIRQNNYFINIFPVDSRTGYLVALNDFVRELNRELKNY
ncbi:DUF2750 domain-containing protein [Flavobacterium hauense]